MNQEKLVKLIDVLHEELKKSYGPYNLYMTTEQKARLTDLLSNVKPILKDHNYYLSTIIKNCETGYITRLNEASKIIGYISTLIKIHSEYDEIKEEYRILQGAKEKLKEAGISFENNDYDSVINNLNTAIELALKDELDIPTTISKINTRKLLDICISDNIGPVDYLKEIVKHVLEIDNKTKHQGYKPSKLDCINAIASVEGFLNKVNKYPFKINESVKAKIFSGI
jgi:hypothetical protein